MKTEYAILFGAALHFVVLIASAATPWVLDWRRALAPLDGFLRKLFWVYGSFIFAVILGFGILGCLNAGAMAEGGLPARSLAAFISIFWVGRLGVQFVVFQQPTFLKSRWMRCGYHGLTIIFILLTGVFGWVAWR